MLALYGPFPLFVWFFIAIFVGGLPVLLSMNRFFNWLARLDSEPPDGNLK